MKQIKTIEELKSIDDLFELRTTVVLNLARMKPNRLDEYFALYNKAPSLRTEVLEKSYDTMMRNKILNCYKMAIQ